MHMKKILSIIVLFMISLTLFAQKDVTQFLGIPIDGFKPEMIKKLKEKGYVSSSFDKNILEGEFNGTQVNIHIATNNNKVCRIMLCDANSIIETDIKIRFNKLCHQFKNNSKYITFDDYTIPDDEDISYEMSVHNKRYEAIFYQQMSAIDSTQIINELRTVALKKYTEEELANPTEDIKNDIIEMSMSYVMDMVSMKPVWFMISEYYGKYYITMFYDNEYNRANGEDL